MCNVDKHEKCLRTIFCTSSSLLQFPLDYYVYRLIPMPTVPSASTIIRSVESVPVLPVAPSLGWLVGAVVVAVIEVVCDVCNVCDMFRGMTFSLKYSSCRPTTFPARIYSQTTYQPWARSVPSSPLRTL